MAPHMCYVPQMSILTICKRHLNSRATGTFPICCLLLLFSFCSDPAYVSGTCALGSIASLTLHFLLMLHTLPSFLLPHYFLNFEQLGVHGHLAESRDQSAQLHQRRNSLQDLHMCHANLLWGNELLVRQRYHLDHKFMQILGALAPQTKIAPLY